MRRLLLAGAVVLLWVSASAAREPRFRAGEVAARTTKQGVAYAVYVPKRWRRGKVWPLMVWVPWSQMTPTDEFARQEQVEHHERWSQACGGMLACAVLLEAHNRENGHLKDRVDRDRYRVLLERDAATVEAALDDLATALPYDRRSVVIGGGSQAAEVALAIATRKPHRFAAIVLTDLWAPSDYIVEANRKWFALAEGETLETARDIPIVMSFSLEEQTLPVRAKEQRAQHKRVLENGFRRVHFLDVDENGTYPELRNPERYARLAKVLEERRQREQRAIERDKHLAEGQRQLERGSLRGALKRVVSARALEKKYGLDAASAALYEALEKRGRAMLTEADAQSRTKRRAEYRRVARLFKGTPLAEEIQKTFEDDA